MAMTKNEIDEKRASIIKRIKQNIDEMQDILNKISLFPNISDNTDLGLFINRIIMRKKDSEKDMKYIELQSDKYIEKYDHIAYFKYVENQISAFHTKYDVFNYQFLLNNKRPYCKRNAPRKLKKSEIQNLISESKASSKNEVEKSTENELGE